MDRETLEEIMVIISKGDTTTVEALFNKPGGRKQLERVVLMIVYQLPFEEREKKDLLVTFQKAMSRLEKRIRRQQDGQKILSLVYGKK